MSQSTNILEVDHVWKAYCRQLKRSMWYGVKDLGLQLSGRAGDRDPQHLRPGEFHAIRDAHFSMKQGECVAMIGPNGAGKSTMLKMINGLIKPDSGSITIRGRIGALIELGTGFNPILSGRENIYINGAVLGMQKSEVDRLFDQIVDFSELEHVIDSPVKTYSTGMKVRLGYSIAANLRPTLLLMDEVLAVGDVGFRMKCFAHLRKLVDEGVSIIIVTHAVAMLSRVATRSIVFGQGSIIHDGDLETGTIIYEEELSARATAHQAAATGNESSATIARIENVQTCNEEGELQTEFETGETVALQIELGCDQPVDRARLVVALCSPVHGELGSVSTPHQQFEFQLDPSGQTITLTLPDFPLMLGSYHFDISLYGPETTDFYHRNCGRGSFRIVGPELDPNGYGLFGALKLEHHWKSDR